MRLLVLLEMVRQLFMNGVLQSGFWHQFAMTAHSPVGLSPEKFKVERVNPDTSSFANNDLEHHDPTGIDHHAFSAGLKKSLFNYMHGVGFDIPLHKWFDFKVPKTTVSPHFIEDCINLEAYKPVNANAKIIWLGSNPSLSTYSKIAKGKEITLAKLVFSNKKSEATLQTEFELGNWLNQILPTLTCSNSKTTSYAELKEAFVKANLGEFELFWHNKTAQELRELGLLVL